jgi:hypothetical protein
MKYLVGTCISFIFYICWGGFDIFFCKGYTKKHWYIFSCKRFLDCMWRQTYESHRSKQFAKNCVFVAFYTDKLLSNNMFVSVFAKTKNCFDRCDSYLWRDIQSKKNIFNFGFDFQKFEISKMSIFFIFC